MRTLGDYVQSLRRERNISQSELAMATQLSQPTISDIEVGKTRLPSVDLRRRLGEQLGTTNIDLLLAAGELRSDELESWVVRHGFRPPGALDIEARLASLVVELSAEVSRSPRLRLALSVPDMTNDEAAFLLGAFQTIPTEARYKREHVEPDEYRRWRDMSDTVSVL